MSNIEVKLVNGKIIITIPDPNADLGKSGSGKSTIVATTGGFVPVTGTDVRLALNIIR